MHTKKRLAVLVSGSGTNLQSIINSIKEGNLPGCEIVVVISNKKDAYALKRAEENKIENIFIDPYKFLNAIDFDKHLVKTISNYNVDLIVLAGYTKILSDLFVKAFPKKIINIHPALLPEFGGKGMYGRRVHEAVLESEVKQTGCTVHFVTEEVDRGPIILQKKVPVIKGDTPDTLAKRVLSEEHEILVEAIKKVLNDR